MMLSRCLFFVSLVSVGCHATDIRNNLTNIAYELMTGVPGNCSLNKEAETQSTAQHSKTIAMNHSREFLGADTNSTGQTLSITCYVNGDGGPWNWTSFQEHTNSFAEKHNGFNIDLTIFCTQDGSVSMKRPHEARLLRSVSILGCLIHSYNVMNPDMVIKQNDLKILDLENCVLIVSLREIMEEIKRDHTAECFINPQLVYYREHNLSCYERYDTILSQDYQDALTEYRKRNCRCPVLEYLELSGNVFFEDKNDVYINLFFPKPHSRSLFPKLKVLILTSNNLKKVPHHLFAGKWWTQFGALEKIDLSRNQIMSLPFRNKQPNGTNPILSVNLSDNAITSVTLDDIKDLCNFWPNSVTLADNPLVCNCSVSNVVSFLKTSAYVDHQSKSTYEEIGGSIECAYPVNLSGVALLDLTDNAVCGRESGNIVLEQRSLMKYITVICGLVIGQALVIVALVWYRKRCKLVSVETVSYRSPVKSIDNKIYDAFISYSSLDETWVMEQLYVFLESNEFNVCLHHKDFVPGACISENILNSIDQSRHTILVLSPNFLRSEWCLLEFRKAFQQTLMEKTGHLIVVVKESVDLVSLENDMQHYIQTHTYLSLSDRQFWKKLNRSLL
ncbi:toll-like receptor Tollo [Ylistrum balloti]|uniref:toll-like receptor Tollo n=1 Tax=Ylistrum balloti TaxID=509963 RepID=UPI0029059452|nr:toll-like receptor Tollo [Ylistrum balloti]